MRAKIQLWGNSLALRLPKTLAFAKGLNKDDEVELIDDQNGIKIVKPVEPETLEDLIASSPEGSLYLTDEEKVWINDEPVGGENVA